MARACIGPPVRSPPTAHRGVIVKADEEIAYGRLKGAEITYLLRMAPFLLDAVTGVESTHAVLAILRCAVTYKPL